MTTTLEKSTSRNDRTLTARDVMTSGVVRVPADLTLAELADVLMENEISGAPVVDEDGTLVGVVSLFDVARQLTGESSVMTDRGSPEFYVRGWEDQYAAEEFRKLRIQEGELTVRDVMTPAIFAVAEDEAVEDVARNLVDGHIHRLLVTRGSEVVGIISSLDLLRAFLGDAPARR